jgi:hypothetical protein
MRESDLYPAVRDWLLSQGYEVHVEVFGHDIVAVKDGLCTVVELKVCLSEKVLDQCRDACNWADFVFAAVPRESAERLKGRVKCCRYYGYGVLAVDGAKVRQKAMARPQPWGRVRRRAYRIELLTGRRPAMDHEVAGLPSCPALREQREKRRAAATT